MKEPRRSEQPVKVKVPFSPERRPPTLDDVFDAVKTRKLMASPHVSKLFREVIVPVDGTGRQLRSDFQTHVEQFNFGALHANTIREAEKEGHEFIKHGCFTLPYPVCFYRCQVHFEDDDKPVGISLLIVDGEFENEQIKPFDRCKGFATVSFTHDHRSMTAMHSISTNEWKDTPEGVAVQFEIPQGEANYWRETASVEDGVPVELRDIAEGSMLAVGLTMILNTKNIRKERVAPPEKPNRARAKQGRPLLPYVTRVYTAVYNRAVQPGTGTHASPRPHRRRAHVRHYPATQWREAYSVPIAAMLVNWDGQPLERGQYEVHGDD